MSKKMILTLVVVAGFIASCASTSSKTEKKEVIYQDGVTQFSATPHNSENLFEKNEKFSSEFNGAINNKNFQIGDRPYPTWTFKPENVSFENNELNLTAKYDPHTAKNSGKQFYFSSGMISTKEKITYGYFEARIKGADLWPGVCPAFWLYGGLQGGNDQDLPVNTITYSEVDIIELQQVPKSKNILALNLHTGAIEMGEDGKKKRKSLKAGIIPDLCKTEFSVDWNPEEDYHLYASEIRPDSIIFYIDNKRVGAKANYYWHLPMSLIVSMGMRNPYERYEAWDRFAVPATKEEADKAGFPTTMYVDYVRAYKRDYSKFKSNKQLFDIESSGYDQKKVDRILKTRKENL